MFAIADTHRFTRVHPVYSAFTSGLPDRPHRQPETGPDVPHEMCLFFAAK